MTMKLRSKIKIKLPPLQAISHRNTSIVHKQKAAGRKAGVVENSHGPDKKLSHTSDMKRSKTSSVDTHSKKNSTQSGKESKIRLSTKRTVEVKRAGRGKNSQSRNAKLAPANVLLTDLDTIIRPTVIENNRSKVVKAAKNIVKQKPGAFSQVKQTSQTSSRSSGDVSRMKFSLINETDSSKLEQEIPISTLPNPLIKKRQSVGTFFVEKQNTKIPDLFSNLVSVKRASDFTPIVSRKHLFQETNTQVNYLNTIETSFSSFRFERTETKEQNLSKLPKQAQFMSNLKLSPTKASGSNTSITNKSLNLKKKELVKDNIIENKIPQQQLSTIQAENNTRNKLERGKAKQKSQVKKVGAMRMIGKKQTQLLTKKQKESARIVGNSRSVRTSSQKSPPSSKKHIPHTSSLAKKSKHKSDADEKKTALVKVSKILINNRKRSQNIATETRVKRLSSPRTLKSLQTVNKNQFSSLTKTTAKESGARKKRKLTSKDHLSQNKSLQGVEQFAPLHTIEVTPIQSLVKISPKSATYSPTIVSSVYKAAKQTTPPQSKKKKVINQKRSLSLPLLNSGNISRQSYSSKFTSTPIRAPLLYRIENTSSLPTRKSGTVQKQNRSGKKHVQKNTGKLPVAAKIEKLLHNDKTVTHAENSKTPVSVVSALSAKKYSKKKNNSLISSVVNEVSEPQFTFGENLHEPTSKVKVRKLSQPVSAKTMNTKSEKLHKSLQNNHVNVLPRKNLKKNLKKGRKLTHTNKSVSYVVKRTQKQYQSRQKVKSKSKPDLQRTSNRPIQSQKNIPSPATEVFSPKSHKRSENSPQTEKQNKPLQKRRNSKAYSSLSSSAKRKSASLSNTSTGAKYTAELMSRSTKVTDIAVPSTIRKGLKKVSASQKKTSRLSENGKIRKSVTYVSDVGGSSHRNTEDNLELINNALLSQAKHSKKSLSSVLNRSLKDLSKNEKSLVSLKKRGPLFPSKGVKKPAIRRTSPKKNKDNKTHSTYSVSKKHAAKYRVNKTHSNRITKSGVKLKARKQSSPKKQIKGRTNTAIGKKFNLSNLEQKKALKTLSRQKVTDVSSFEFQNMPNLPKGNKASKLAQSKAVSLNKSGKLSAKVDKRESLTGNTSLVKAAQVKRNTFVTPKKLELSQPKTVMQQVVSLSSQKKIFTQGKKKVTKVGRSEKFVNEKSSKLLSNGVKKQTGKRLGKVSKVEMINWLTLGQNTAVQLLPRKTLTEEVRYFTPSKNLKAAKISNKKKNPQLPEIIEGRKPAPLSQKRTRSAKTRASDKIVLVAPGRKKSQKPSTAGYKIQRTKSSTSPKKTGKKTPNKVANLLLNKNISKLSRLTKATKLVVPSAKLTRLGKSKEIEKIGLASPGLKNAPEATSKGSCKIQRTKSAVSTKKKDNVAFNKNKISGKLPSNDKVKRRKSISSLTTNKRVAKPLEIDNINLFLQGKNEESELSPSGFKIQKTKSSSTQKKTGKKKIPDKILGNKLSKKLSPKVLISRISVTSSPNISRITKVKQINVLSSEQDETPKALPARYNTQTIKTVSSSKKTGKTLKKISETSKRLSNKVSPQISTKVNRRKSIPLSPKITRLSRSKDIEKSVLSISGDKGMLKHRESKTHKTKLFAATKEAKRTVKQIPSKIHTSKVNSKAFVKIDANISSPKIGRGNKRRTNLRNILVSQGQKGKSKQLSGRQKNKKPRFTDVSKSGGLGPISNLLAQSRELKSTKGTRNISLKKTEEEYTLNKSFKKSQPSRNISTVRPFNLISNHPTTETSPSQLKKIRGTPLITTDIIYARRAQNIPSLPRETAQASPTKLSHIYDGLSRRSLFSSDITEGKHSPQTNYTSLEWKVSAPLDTEIAESSYTRQGKLSQFPEKTRAESYIYNFSYTSNDKADRLPVRRAAKLPQTSNNNVSYSEQSKKVTTSKVSFSSSVGEVDDHTRYITSTPFPVSRKSALSSMYIGSARNSYLNKETVSNSQPILSYRHHVTTDLRLSNPGTSYVVSERDTDEESGAVDYTKKGNSVETEEQQDVYINREVEENEELQESRDKSDVYVEEIEEDENIFPSQNSQSKQCIIS